MSSLALIKKECKQNMIIFVIPYLILLLGRILCSQGEPISNQWRAILAVTLPIALAGAYGLQSFDMEEYSQTRDFLFTKPLKLTQILWTKYLTGLIILLPVSLLWIFLIIPDTFTIPNLANLETFWLVTVILILLNVFTITFLISILIRGPLKIIIALAILPFSCGWFFFTWSQFLTVLFRNNWIFKTQPVGFLLTSFFTLFLGIILILSIHKIAYFNMSNLSFSSYKKEFKPIFLIIIGLPIVLSCLTWLVKPPIYPFNQFLAGLFASDDWFVALEGVKQPKGRLYAFNDTRGRLGLASLGHQPQVIYQPLCKSNNKNLNVLNHITWSPDGTKLAFVENHHIKVFQLDSKKITVLTEGTIPLWSADGELLLIAQLLDSQTVNSSLGPVTNNHYRIFKINLETGLNQELGQLNSSETSMAWDSIRNRLFFIDISGKLVTINLNDRSLINHQLFQNSNLEPVIFSKMIPSDNQNHFKLLIFSINLKNLKKQHYNIRGYDLNYQTDQIKEEFFFKNRSYKDLVYTNNRRKMLIRTEDNGLYRLINLPKEAHQ